MLAVGDKCVAAEVYYSLFVIPVVLDIGATPEPAYFPLFCLLLTVHEWLHAIVIQAVWLQFNKIHPLHTISSMLPHVTLEYLYLFFISQ